MIISWVRRDGAFEAKFWTQITVFPRQTFRVSSGNNIVACNVANDVKRRQIATDNGGQFPVTTTQVER